MKRRRILRRQRRFCLERRFDEKWREVSFAERYGLIHASLCEREDVIGVEMFPMVIFHSVPWKRRDHLLRILCHRRDIDLALVGGDGDTESEQGDILVLRADRKRGPAERSCDGGTEFPAPRPILCAEFTRILLDEDEEDARSAVTSLRDVVLNDRRDAFPMHDHERRGCAYDALFDFRASACEQDRELSEAFRMHALHELAKFDTIAFVNGQGERFFLAGQLPLEGRVHARVERSERSAIPDQQDFGAVIRFTHCSSVSYCFGSGAIRIPPHP